ncbi:Peptidase family M48 [Sphingomonas laterariae]|uniref:Peptidase family M48 n=1 Tax=Edaphosphingomonas laterariae TaxID=861865 RepID=A0A239FNZ8_9SPHN|nr:M48 family metallopeptidase [Sphingomonas laterariae]SNS58348.1 Peptidase family M48 [Sphingomonas laterariae]
MAVGTSIWLKLLVGASLVQAAAPASAEPAADPQPISAIDAGLLALRDGDVRVAAIAFRLATANLPLCADHSAATGLVIHDGRQYRGKYREAAERLFLLGDSPGVMGVVPGSPAALAGIQANDRLVAINGVAVDAADSPRSRKGGDYEPVQQLLDQLDAAAEAGPVAMQLVRDGQTIDVSITPLATCASRIQLLPSGKLDAAADGRMISITSAMVDFTRNDDELAFIIAHEMAHNALRHRARLDDQKVSRGLLSIVGANARRIKETECEADHVGLYMAARAGFAVEQAPEFWRRFGRTYDFGPLSDPTHPSGKQRAESASAALVQIADERAKGLPLEPRPQCQ